MNNILLIYGGNSVEHEISIITALQIKNKYTGKYNIILCYLKNGKFYISKKLNKLNFYKKKTKLKPITFNANKNNVKVKGRKLKFSAVWIVSHGKNCEDGTLYSYFKTLNIDVIAMSPCLASASHDKAIAKRLTNSKSLPFKVITKENFFNEKEEILLELKKIGFPIILKPADLGSSIGVCSVANSNEFYEKCENIFSFSTNIIAEKQLLNFEEFNIALYTFNDEIYLSEIEKVSSNHILSYEDKYINKEKSLSGQTKELPALITKNLKDIIESSAIQIYNDLKLKFVVRIDFLYDITNKELYFNEVNNIPGSLAYYLFEKKGISINTLVNSILDEGLFYIEQEKSLITQFENNIFKSSNFTNTKISK